MKKSIKDKKYPLDQNNSIITNLINLLETDNDFEFIKEKKILHNRF